jgi:hypothetical protein
MSKMAEYTILSEPLREELKSLLREVVREELRALNGNGYASKEWLANEPLRNIANTLNVDAIVGFRVGHGVVCWNCIRAADEPRRFDVVYGAEEVICARCKERPL